MKRGLRNGWEWQLSLYSIPDEPRKIQTLGCMFTQNLKYKALTPI